MTNTLISLKTPSTDVLDTLHSHLLVWVTLSYLSGITVSAQLSLPVQPLLVCLLGSIACLCFLSSNRSLSLLFLFSSFLLIGIVLENRSKQIPSSVNHVYHCITKNQDAVVIGHIERIYGFNGETSRFDLSALAIRTENRPFHNVDGLIRFTLKQSISHLFQPGDQVAIRAHIGPVNHATIPGTFDYASYLAQQDIYVRGNIRSVELIQRVMCDSSRQKKWKYYVEILRHRINTFIDDTLLGDKAAIYKAILTGDRASLSPETKEAFTASGCLHVLAISGLHVSILGVVFYTVLFWLLRRSQYLILRINTKKTAVLLTAFPLIVYALLSGGKTPVVRACVMSVLVILALCSNRKHSFFPLVACAALVILLLSPSALFTPSFQLTFTAVLAIGMAVPIIKMLCRRIKDSSLPSILHAPLYWVLGSCGVSIAASLGTAPLLLYHFNRVSIIGVLANLVIEPLLCFWGLIVGFMAIPLLFISPQIAEILLQFGAIGISYAISAASFFQSFSFSSIYLPQPSIPLILLYYCGLNAFFLPQHSGNTSKAISTVCFSLSLIFFFSPPARLVPWDHANQSDIIFLDVGHGNCTFLSLPSGRDIIIDGGAMSSPIYDIGQSLLGPFLWSRGVRKIDDIIVTHPDSDHYNGIPFLLEHFSVTKLWISNSESTGESWKNLLRIAKKKGVTIIHPRQHQYVYDNENISLKVVADMSTYKELSSITNNGLVLKYRDKALSILFPGDISAAAESKLVEENFDVNADVLLAAHHGSSTSNSMIFLKNVNPDYLVIAAGKSKRTYFPAKVVVKRSKDLDISLLSLNSIGTVSITSKNGEYEIHPPQKKNR